MIGKNINTVPECLSLHCKFSNDPTKLWVFPCPACLWAVWSWEPEQSEKVGRSPCNGAVCRCCLFALHFPSTSKASLRPSLNNTPNLKLCKPQRNMVLQPPIHAHSAHSAAVCCLGSLSTPGLICGKSYKAVLQPGRGALRSAGQGKDLLVASLCFWFRSAVSWWPWQQLGRRHDVPSGSPLGNSFRIFFLARS